MRTIPFDNPARRDRLVNAKTDRLASRFSEMFPAIELEVAYRWAGTFGETKDGLPYIGQIRQMPRCHFVLGFGGNGISLQRYRSGNNSGCADGTLESERASVSV